MPLQEDSVPQCIGSIDPKSRTCQQCLLAGACEMIRLLKIDVEVAESCARFSAAPCGHPGEYSYTPDGKGIKILCMQCQKERATARVLELRELAEAAHAHQGALRTQQTSHSSGRIDAALRKAEKRLDDAMERCMPEKYRWHGELRPKSKTALAEEG